MSLSIPTPRPYATGVRVGRRLPLLLLLVVLGLASRAWSEDPQLATGVRQVEEGDFEGAVVTLELVARRLAPSDGHDAVQAFLYLGIAQIALDRREAAVQSFRRALDLDPGLELSPDQFSPKVRGALAEARQARDAEARAAGSPPPPEPRKGGKGKTLLLAGAGVAAGVGIAVIASGSGESTAPGEVRFTGARFATGAVECPDGAIDIPLAVGIEVDASNTGARTTLSAVSATLIIVDSPAVPSEIGFASSAPTTASPSAVPEGTTTLHLQTSLTCANGSGDPARYNEWSGRVVIATAQGAVTLDTVDRLRVNIP
jgi:hypothetical protein